MCGVAGIYRPGGAAVEAAALRRMAAALRHRGPDGAGAVLLAGGTLGLAHLRLALVDVAGGVQPLFNEDRSLCAVVNGELYDHRALRAALLARGHGLRTRCDAELLLHLYEDRGLDCLAELDGEFAALLWDGRARRLIAIRDAAGVRPLFVRRHRDEGGEAWLFASEAKAILAHPGVPRALAPEYLAGPLFGAFGRAPASFAGIDNLAPGTALIVAADGAASTHRWWAPRIRPDPQLTRERAAEAVRAAMQEAVDRRLDADVPVACLVSGGLDSTIVAGLAAARRPGLAAFHLSFAGTALDERAAAHAVAQRHGLTLHRVDVTASALALALPATLAATEAAVVNPHAAARYLLAQAVRAAGYKVALSGEGADEWWGGYPWFLLEALWRGEASAEPAAADARARLVAREQAARDVLWAAEEDWRRGPHPLGWPCFLHLRARRGDAAVRHLLRDGPRLVDDAMPSRRVFAGHDLAALRALDPRDASRLLALDQLAGYILPNLGDRVELAHGVEGRPPFLGRAVVELAQRVPAALLFDPLALREKAVLRDAFAGLLPPELVRGAKRPFFAPSWQAVCMTAEGAALRERHLAADAIAAAGLFDPALVAAMLPRWLSLPVGSPLAPRLDRMFGAVLCCQIVHAELVAPEPVDPPAGFELPWLDARGGEVRGC